MKWVGTLGLFHNHYHHYRYQIEYLETDDDENPLLGNDPQNGGKQHIRSQDDICTGGEANRARPITSCTRCRCDR